MDVISLHSFVANDKYFVGSGVTARHTKPEILAICRDWMEQTPSYVSTVTKFNTSTLFLAEAKKAMSGKGGWLTAHEAAKWEWNKLVHEKHVDVVELLRRIAKKNIHIGGWFAKDHCCDGQENVIPLSKWVIGANEWLSSARPGDSHVSCLLQTIQGHSKNLRLLRGVVHAIG